MFNRKDIVFLLFFSLAIQIGLQIYLSYKKKDSIQKIKKEPLAFDITFIEEVQVDEVLSKIDTSYGSFIFSNKGAVLTDYRYERIVHNQMQEFIVLEKNNIVQKELSPFLIACKDKTPYQYVLEKIEETESGFFIQYGYKKEEFYLNKIFFVHKNVPQVDLTLKLVSGDTQKFRILLPSPILKGLDEDEMASGFIVSKNNGFKKITPKMVHTLDEYINLSLSGVENKYFVFSLIKNIGNIINRTYFQEIDNRTILFLETQAITENADCSFSFYLGPKEPVTMQKVEKTLDKIFDYGLFGFLTRPLLAFLRFLNKIITNYGCAIIVATLVLKLILLPFTWSGPKKMKKLEEYQKKMAYLEQRYKNDKEGFSKAREELLKHDGFPPLGGCLPLLIQLPFLAALQSGLNNSFDLYRAPFILWITDLSVADPYYVLPFLTLIFMLSGGLLVRPKSGARQNISALIMGCVGFAFTANLSAGLSLAILSNVVLHGLQMFLQKRIGAI